MIIIKRKKKLSSKDKATIRNKVKDREGERGLENWGTKEH